MDECYGKQIDYYNQLPSSTKTIEDLLKRLERSESINEKLKNKLFNELADISILNCDIDFMILYSDGSPSASGCWENMKLSFKIDKEKKQIILDIYEKYEWINDPHDLHNYKLKGTDDKSKVETVTYGEESVLPVPAIIDLNDCWCGLGPDDSCGPPSSAAKKYYWFHFNNKADWEKRRRREIEDICIPINEVKYKPSFKKLFDLLQITQIVY